MARKQGWARATAPKPAPLPELMGPDAFDEFDVGGAVWDDADFTLGGRHAAHLAEEMQGDEDLADLALAADLLD